MWTPALHRRGELMPGRSRAVAHRLRRLVGQREQRRAGEGDAQGVGGVTGVRALERLHRPRLVLVDAGEGRAAAAVERREDEDARRTGVKRDVRGAVHEIHPVELLGDVGVRAEAGQETHAQEHRGAERHPSHGRSTPRSTPIRRVTPMRRSLLRSGS